MRRLARTLLVLLCAFALAGGNAVSIATATAVSISRDAGNSCGHERSDETGAPSHRHDGFGCLTCCPGACVSVPGLAPFAQSDTVAFAAASVTYWDVGLSLNGRSIAPDPAPPRTSA